MKTLILSNKNKKKLNLVKHILFSVNSTTYLNELMDIFALNKSTLQRYLNEIKEDFSVFNEPVILNKSNKGKVSIEFKTTISIKYIIVKLESTYMKQSPIADTLIALANKNYTSVATLAEDLHLSETAVYKHLSKINVVLSKYNIAISFDTTLNFKGKEYEIRYFLFNLYWSIYSTIETPPLLDYINPKYIDIRYLKNCLNIKTKLSKSQEIQIQMIIAITIQRNKFVKKSKANVAYLKDTECLREFVKEESHSADLKSNCQISKEEISFAICFVRIIIPNIDSYIQKKVIVDKYKKSNLPLYTHILEYCILIEKKMSIDLSDNDYINICYFLIIATISLNHFNFFPCSFDKLPIIYEDNKITNKNYYEQSRRNINSLIKEFPSLKKLTSQEQDFIRLFLLSINTNRKKQNALNIHVIYSLNPIINYTIKDFLSQIFNENLIYFCESPLEADILISNEFEHIKNDINSFYFDSPDEERVWKDLINFVSMKINEHLFYYLN